MKKLIIPILVLIVAGGIIVWRVSFRNAELSVGKETAAYHLSAQQLQQEFEEDEATANSKYLNKTISVAGTIAKVEETEEGLNVYLQEPESMSGVICGFNRKIATPDDFKAGEEIKIKGLCTGYLFDVVLVKCQIESH
jgi:hypothetical protein